MRLNKFILTGLIITGLHVVVLAQDNHSVRILFYNTENFFDAFDDSTTLDEEFTPGGERHWSIDRFTSKANHLYKVLVAAGGWSPPDLIGLAEVENDYVLNYLVNETPYAKYRYRFVHFDSPDVRGIDVALLYNPERYTVRNALPIHVKLSDDNRPTRDILYIDGTIGDSLRLHLFVNHWPSRVSGALETESLRITAAKTLKLSVDTLLSSNPGARVIIMGDFNDEPQDKSLKILCDPLSGKHRNKDHLVNLMAPILQKEEGTLFYGDRWWMFDQFIVSNSLTDGSGILTLRPGTPVIVKADFLVTEEVPNKPFRTFNGYRYTGGFSDHLPVSMDLVFAK